MAFQQLREVFGDAGLKNPDAAATALCGEDLEWSDLTDSFRQDGAAGVERVLNPREGALVNGGARAKILAYIHRTIGGGAGGSSNSGGGGGGKAKGKAPAASTKGTKAKKAKATTNKQKTQPNTNKRKRSGKQ